MRHAYPRSHSVSLAPLSHTHTLSLSHTHTVSLTHTLFLSLAHTQTLSHSLSLSRNATPRHPTPHTLKSDPQTPNPQPSTLNPNLQLLQHARAPAVAEASADTPGCLEGVELRVVTLIAEASADTLGCMEGVELRAQARKGWSLRAGGVKPDLACRPSHVSFAGGAGGQAPAQSPMLQAMTLMLAS